MARARTLHHQLAAERRHERGPRRHDHRRLDLHRVEPALRRALPSPRSEDARAMIEIGARESLHAWLVSERPRSRRQAFLIRLYGAWRAFVANRLAVVGLAI